MSDFTPFSDAAVWDWYSTSIKLKGGDWKDLLAPELFNVFPDHDARECSPNRPFKVGNELVCPSTGKRLMLMSSGGDHVKGVTQFQCTGSNAPSLASALAASGVMHEPSRVDAAIDWFEDSLFDTLARAFKMYAVDKGLKISTPGDWERGEGRTLYIGSRGSALMVRLYEKGYEERKKGDFSAPLNWVRFEVEVKYKKKDERKRIAGLKPSDCFRLGWVHGLCETIMFQSHRLPMPSGYKGLTDEERRVNWLIKQYGNALRGLIDSKGSAEAMGVYLSERLDAA
jgi:hypothetical protein